MTKTCRLKGRKRRIATKRHLGPSTACHHPATLRRVADARSKLTASAVQQCPLRTEGQTRDSRRGTAAVWKGTEKDRVERQMERRENIQAAGTKTADAPPDAASRRVREQRASRVGGTAMFAAERTADGRLETGPRGENGEHSTIMAVRYHMTYGRSSSLPKTAGY